MVEESIEVNELARRLGLTSASLYEKLRRMGIPLQAHPMDRRKRVVRAADAEALLRYYGNKKEIAE